MAEPPRNRTRPPESDEMRAGSPRAASATERWAARINSTHRMRTEGPRKGTPRPPTKFEIGPSSFGASRIASEDQVQAAIRRREMYARHSGTPLVSQLVEDPDFYHMCNAGGDEGAIRADWPEIRSGRGGAKAEHSRRLLHDLVSQYEEITGVMPVWD
jgi:hypothetical protein